MNGLRKTLAMALVGIMVFSGATAFASCDWINSDIEGSVGAGNKIRIQDDLHAAVNQEWLLAAQYPEGAMMTGTFQERGYEVQGEVLALLNGDTMDTDAGRRVQTLYSLMMDMDKRNELAMSPVIPYVEAIAAISDMEELTAYLMRTDVPYRTLYSCASDVDFKDSDHKAVIVAGRTFLLGDADEYKSQTASGARRQQATTQVMVALLERVGYTGEQAQAMAEDAFAFDGLMAAHAYGLSDTKQTDYYERIYNRCTLAELEAISPNFPIAQTVSRYTAAGVDTFILHNPDDLANVSALYTIENLEVIKHYLICRTLLTCVQMLDQTCLDVMDHANAVIAGMADYHSVVADMAYATCNGMLMMDVAQMYVETYVSADTKQEVTQMVEDIRRVFRGRLEKATWMGEETRAYALEKLDNLIVRVAYPDDWSPYTLEGLTLRGYDEGGTILEAMMTITDYARDKDISTVLDPIDHSEWTMAPQTVNAFYSPTDNSINILAGVLGGDLYDVDGDEAAKLGTIGYIIGHEITHGFDTTGSQFDKSGNMLNWWTDEDRAAFMERTDKVQAYYSSIEALPGLYVDGQLTLGETVADLGGVSCTLELGSEKECFDYDTYFRSLARCWRARMPQQIAEILIQSEVHPLGYLRTNVTAQQFEEFYDTYHVVEGDGMYLAPEDRLSVW